MAETITVKKGDTLSGIAQRAGVSLGDLSGFKSGDPNLIFPGEQININRSAPQPLSPGQEPIGTGGFATEAEIDKYKEGGVIPGKGTILPDGTIRPLPQDQTTPVTTTQPTSNNDKLFSTSNDVVSEEKDAKDYVTDGFQVSNVDISGLINASDAYVQELTDARKRLAQELNTEISDINQIFNETRSQLQAGQKKEKGTVQSRTLRLGGFLGESGSGTGVMVNLAVQHKNELVALAGKRAAAISAARKAFNENDTKLATNLAREARDLEAEIYKRRNDFFDNTIKAAKEEREARNQIRDDARSSLTTILTQFGGIPLAELDDNSFSQIAELSMAAGIPLSQLNQPTIREISEQNTERQRAISNAISQANLSIRSASYNLSVEKFNESQEVKPLDAERLGLPKSTVGQNSNVIEADLANPNVIPEWFNEQKGGQATLQDWNTFRNSTIEKSPFTLYQLGQSGQSSPDSTIIEDSDQ